MLSFRRLTGIYAQQQPFRHTFILQEDLFGPLLFTGKGSDFTDNFFRQRLHFVLVQAGIHDSNIKGHSFRLGVATWLIGIGVPVNQIKDIGFWSSDAVLRYIDPHFTNLLDTMVHFCKSLHNA
jgi:hypothetical protein